MPRDIKLREGLQTQIQRLRKILTEMEEELHKRGIDTNRTNTGIPGKSEDIDEFTQNLSDEREGL